MYEQNPNKLLSFQTPVDVEIMRRREVKWLEMLTQWDAYMLRNYRKVIIFFTNIVVFIIIMFNIIITLFLLPDEEGGCVQQQLANNFLVQVSSAPTPSYNHTSSNTLVAKKTVFHVRPTLRPELSCFGGNGGARPLR